MREFGYSCAPTKIGNRNCGTGADQVCTDAAGTRSSNPLSPDDPPSVYQAIVGALGYVTCRVASLSEAEGGETIYAYCGDAPDDAPLLRYGVTNDVSLIQWRGEILADQFQSGKRRNGSIVLKNNAMEVVRRYNFVDAWPVAWEGPSFSSSGSELAIEMIELAHHGISVA